MTSLDGLNFNSRPQQIQLLRDSPDLSDRVAAHLMTMDARITLTEAHIRADVLVAEFDKYQREAPDYIPEEEENGKD